MKKKVIIDENKPLTPLEEAFVSEYIKCRIGQKAAIRAGFSPKTARTKANYLIHKKPNTKKAIREKLSRYFERLEYEAFEIIQKISRIAMAKASDLTPIKGGRVLIPDTDTLSEEANALYAGAEEHINERGDICVSVKMHNQLDALKTMLKYFGLLDKTGQAKRDTLDETKQAIRAIRSGTWTVLEAACYLEEEGVPLPDTIRILLSKYADQEEDQNDSDMVIPSPEEMEKRRNERLKEIEGQKESFLPKRQQEVRELKEELGDKNRAWAVVEKNSGSI
jgi:phage terminase small subunit